MKLWILRPADVLSEGDNPWDPWYDKAVGFVVRAEDETAARVIADENAGDENRALFLGKKIANTKTPWLDVKYSTCLELTTDGDAGEIIQDFNAA